ncbi:hypothetical protein P9J64_16715 [Deltaproteobacteria bacterium IMCC39524]|nr:hypothetical protein [Deltaproteobacteria bacterium IMCC39524]
MNFNELEELRQTNNKAFKKVASRRYGMEERALNALLDDYELEPKGSDGPPGHDAVALTMSEIAFKLDLPVKVVGRLQNIGEIGRPITCNDFENLKFFAKIWGNHFFLRCQISKLSQKQREELIKRPELSSKWERWIYSKYFFNKIEYGHGGRMINPERRILINEIAEDIESIYRVPNCKNTRDHILKIRQMANNDRKKVGQGRATERSVLKARSLPESEFELFKDTYVFTEYS